VIIGSQAIHGEIVDPPDELLQSMEVDMYPLADPDRADDIDGALGDGSWFEYTNGYFAHGVGPTTAKAPVGWMERLVRVDVEPLVPGRKPVAYCMERHDMILAKLVRGEQRDVDYARVAVRAGLVHAAVLQTPYRRFARRCGGSQPREGHRARARCGLAFRSTRGTREVHQADRERGHLTRPSRPKVTYAGDFMARSARAWTRFWGSGSRSGTSRSRSRRFPPTGARRT
jgi:hypothetical protein